MQSESLQSGKDDKYLNSFIHSFNIYSAPAVWKTRHTLYPGEGYSLLRWISDNYKIITRIFLYKGEV